MTETKKTLSNKKTTTLSLFVNEEGNSIITAHVPSGDIILKGLSKISVSYSTRGRIKGTRFNVTVLTPILKDGVTDMRPENYELPVDLDKVLALSTFWDTHAVKLESAATIKSKSKKNNKNSHLVNVDTGVESEIEEAVIEELVDIV